MEKICIIGAGSVVTHSIPDNSVCAGVPAKIIESTEQYEKKVKLSMPDEWDEKTYQSNAKEYLEKVIPSPRKQ